MNITTQLKTSGEGYIQSLDSVRALAAIFVLLLHGSYGFVQGGWIGVDIFFVLSGYLITRLLINEYDRDKNISISQFYWRRAARLIPALFICVLLANILWTFSVDFFADGNNRLLATIGSMFYCTNLLDGKVSGNMAHLWSLSVEEHFYLLWPILFIPLINIAKPSLRMAILGTAILLVGAFKIFVFHYLDDKGFGAFLIHSNRFTFCKIDGILLGSILAFPGIQQQPELKLRKGIVNIIFVLLAFIYIGILFFLDERNLILKNGGFVFINLLTMFTIWYVVKNARYKWLNTTSLTWVGKRSYGIYLYHFPIFLAFEPLRTPGDIYNLVLVTGLRFLLTFIIAGLSYKYLEQPILQLSKTILLPAPVRNTI
jgi:peptidoglycan/LPS O-acetylase OafA/YrhL